MNIPWNLLFGTIRIGSQPMRPYSLVLISNQHCHGYCLVFAGRCNGNYYSVHSVGTILWNALLSMSTIHFLTIVAILFRRKNMVSCLIPNASRHTRLRYSCNLVRNVADSHTIRAEEIRSKRHECRFQRIHYIKLRRCCYFLNWILSTIVK